MLDDLLDVYCVKQRVKMCENHEINVWKLLFRVLGIDFKIVCA